MELKDFVKETLVQITEGGKEAQEEFRKNGCRINPGYSDHFFQPHRPFDGGGIIARNVGRSPNALLSSCHVVVISILVSHVPTA